MVFSGQKRLKKLYFFCCTKNFLFIFVPINFKSIMKATIITTEGDKRQVEFNTFIGARNLICNEGYSSPLEMIYLEDGEMLLIDEDGKNKNLSMNSIATEMAHNSESIYPSDYVCGDVIFIDNMTEFDDLPYE